MKSFQKRVITFTSFSQKRHFVERISLFFLLMFAVLPLVVVSQTTKTQPNRKKNNQFNIEGQQKSTIAHITPLVDYHTHIFTVEAYARLFEPLLPPAELPENFARLLRERDEAFKQKNPSAMAEFYTKDALFLNPSGPNWIQGRKAIDFVGQNISGSFRAVPVAYAAGETNGYIAGYWTIGEGAKFRYASNFLLSLRKEADGKWRIAAESITIKGPPAAEVGTAEQLVKHLDAEGIKRAVVLSTAYWFGSGPSAKPEEGEYDKVRRENDYVAQQVALFPQRLVGFCSFNPLKDYALEELDRCGKNPNLKGLKLHLGDAQADLLNPLHLERIRQVFLSANQKKLPIVVHIDGPGGRIPEKTKAFVNQVLPVAPDIPIQIAHLGGSGPNYDGEEALTVFVDAITSGGPRMKNIYFEVSSEVTHETPPATLELVAKRIRQLGLQRVVYGSDRAGTRDDRSKSGNWDWSAFKRLPLTKAEFRIIANNVAPYLRYDQSR
jgi:predicted TIM-barrel fold metal-dependent hydrolase